MQHRKLKIWVKFFFKSFIWLILPLCIFGNIQSCSNYIEAGKHLTPYSVSVSGYFRSNGTYVRPYNRRPPGSVTHDAPYENKRMYLGLLFFVCLIGGGGSIIGYAKMSISEIKRQQKIIQDIEDKKREEERQCFINGILKTIDFNFSELTIIPPNLEKGESLKCKFCEKYISTDDFYVSFIAVSNRHFVCINCVRKRISIGRDQPRSKYIDEIKYFDNYYKTLNEFKTKFINEINLDKINTDKIKFKDSDLKWIFDSELNKIAATK